MDKEFASTARKTVDREAWDNTITKFLKLREEFPTLQHLSLQLPYGIEQKSWDNFIWNAGRDIGKNLVYEPCIVDEAGFKNKYIYPLTLQHKIVRSGRKVVSIEQHFSTVSTKTVMNKHGKRVPKDEILFDPRQVISKKNGYYYRWNTKGDLVRISKLIGTANISQIRRQGFSLVRECERFIFMYCQG